MTMRIRRYDILDGIQSAEDTNVSDVIVFGDGLDAVSVSYNGEGRLRVASSYGAIIVEPSAANCIFIRTQR